VAPRPKARAAISADPAAAEERYINREQLRELIPASDMTLWRWQRDTHIAFPLPVKLGANGRNYWWLPRIHAWLRRREEPAEPRNRPQGGRKGDGKTEQTV
jgi:predicted DNA-binding transcriptional regulator AlpA